MLLFLWISKICYQVCKPIADSHGSDIQTTEDDEITKLDVDILHPQPTWLRRRGQQVAEVCEESRTSTESSQDAILCSILSKLKTREAVRASILSRRWKNIWKYMPDLRFNGFNMLDPISISSREFDRLDFAEKMRITSERRDKFIQSVEGFLHHHQGSGVKLFRVEFGLNKEHAHHLDKWVDFAIQSGAKDLVLHLDDHMLLASREGHRLLRKIKLYDFPFHLFDNGMGSSIESINVSYCNFKPHANFTGFSYLKCLIIQATCITDIQVHSLLSCCLLIEELEINFCERVVNLVIRHHSNRLKAFSVSNCVNLKKIELDSISLTLFRYQGKNVPFILKNASKVPVAEISLSAEKLDAKSYTKKLISELPRLEGLTLRCYARMGVMITSDLCKFTHLKMLKLHIGADVFDALLLAVFLNAAPLLEKFHVVICYGFHRQRCHASKCLHIPDSKHINLKQFEVSRFRGWEDEVDLVSFVLRNVVSLEVVTLDPFVWIRSEIGWERMAGSPESSTDEARRLDAYRKLSETPRKPGARLVLR